MQQTTNTKHLEVAEQPKQQGQPTFEAGQSINGFQIKRKLGEGGFGQTWLVQWVGEAIGLRPGTDYVLKIPNHSEGESLLAEASHLKKLSHERIVPYRGTGRLPQEKTPYLVLDYVAGAQSLAEYVTARRPSLAQLLALIKQICEGVTFLHQNLIVHGDLTPHNILVNEQNKVVLIDFGLARTLGSDESEPMKGISLNYCSPEQWHARPLGVASDIYALGVIIYEMLTGLKPYETRGLEPNVDADKINALICGQRHKTMSAAIASMSADQQDGRGWRTAWQAKLAGDLDAIVARAMAQEPGERFGDVDEMWLNIQDYQEHRPVAARKPSKLYYLGKWLRRNSMVLAVISLFLVILLSWGSQLSRSNWNINRERVRADTTKQFLIGLFQGKDPTRHPGEKPSLRQILELGRKRVIEGLPDQPELRLDVLENLALVHESMGYYPESVNLIHLAQEQWKALEATTYEQHARLIYYEAVFQVKAGEYHRAEPRFHHAREALNGRHSASPLNVDIDFYLAYLARLRGDLEGAERYLRKHLARLEPPKLLRRSLILEQLSSIALIRGDLQEAARLLDEALEPLDHTRQEQAMAAAFLLCKRAVITILTGEGEAEAEIEEGLALSSYYLGEDHPLMGTVISLHAYALTYQGDYSRAATLFKRADTLLQAHMGPDHLDRARNHTMLAQPFLREGHNTSYRARAFTELIRKLERHEQWILPQLGGSEAMRYMAKGDYEQAIEELRPTLRHMRANQTAGHPGLPHTESLLAIALLLDQRYAEAKDQLQCAINHYQHMKVIDIHALSSAYFFLGQTCFLGGAVDEGLRNLAQGQMVRECFDTPSKQRAGTHFMQASDMPEAQKMLSSLLRNNIGQHWSDEETARIFEQAGHILNSVPNYEQALASQVLSNPIIRQLLAPIFVSESINLEQAFELFDRLAATWCFKTAIGQLLKDMFTAAESGASERFRDTAMNCQEARSTYADFLGALDQVKEGPLGNGQRDQEVKR